MRYIPVIKIGKFKCFLIAKYFRNLNSQLHYCIQPNLCVITTGIYIIYLFNINEKYFLGIK